MMRGIIACTTVHQLVKVHVCMHVHDNIVNIIPLVLAADDSCDVEILCFCTL